MSKGTCFRWMAAAAVAITTSLTTSADVLADDQGGIGSAQDLFRLGSDSLEAETTGTGFGRFQVEGTFRSAVVVPGTSVAVAVDTTESRLVRYDLDTNDLIRADRQLSGGTLFRLIPSPDGTWVSTLLETDVATYALTRFRASDLAFDSEFTFTTLGSPTVVPVPGDEASFVISSGFDVTMYRDGVALPDLVEDPLRAIYDIEVFAGGAGFATTSQGFHSFTAGPTGIVDFVPLPTIDVGSTMEVNDPAQFLFMRGNEERVFDIASLTSRSATAYDRALIDPTQPYRYGDKIYDQDTGQPVAPFRDCEQTPRGAFVPIGDGWMVGFELEFRNVLLRCGAYGEFTSVTPSRVFDTRSGSGYAGDGLPLERGTVRRVKVHGLGGVPEEGVESVVLNVTAVRQREAGSALNFITVWPAGLPRPTVSNLNAGDGETVGNMVTVSTAESGYVDVYSDIGVVDLTVDVFGYFSSSIAPEGSRYDKLRKPFRLTDTRQGPAPRRLGPGESIEIDLSQSSLPLFRPTAAVVNVTAVQPSERGFFKIYPTGGTRPDASSMNFGPNTNTNRLVTVSLNNGRFTVLNDVGSAHVTIDIVGTYRSVSGDISVIRQSGRFVGIEPFRVVDTRERSPFDGDGRIPGDFAYIRDDFSPEISIAANLTAIRPTETGFMSTGAWNEANVDGCFGFQRGVGSRSDQSGLPA